FCENDENDSIDNRQFDPVTYMITLLRYLSIAALLASGVSPSSSPSPSSASHCLQPFVPENGHVIFAEPGPYPIGTVARYSCAVGFERLGPEERRCGSDGRWRGRSPVCVVDVARGRPFDVPEANETSRWPLPSGECAETLATFIIDLAAPSQIQAVQIGLGKASNRLDQVELFQDTGEVCKCGDETPPHLTANATNTLLTMECTCNRVVRIRVSARGRLQLCTLKVFASDAVSPWQCGLNESPSLEHLGVFEGACYSASKIKADWARAARACADAANGGTLPMRQDEASMNFLATTLEGLRNPAPFYWIGVVSDMNEWRYADGAPVGPIEMHFGDKVHAATDGEAILVSREAAWKWAVGLQTGWNQFVCRSKPKFCTSPGVGEAGRVSFSSHSYAVGTTSFYECEEGYELDGNSQRICGVAGKWSGTIPSCQLVDCGLPPSFDGQTHLLNKTTLFGAVVDYECPRGFRPVAGASTRRSCGADGAWSAPPPLCARVDCGKPSSVANGNAHFTTTNLNSTAVYECGQAFRLIGHDTVYCSERGSWEPVSPVCYDVSALREMQSGSGEANALLAIAAVALLVLLVVIVIRHARSPSFSLPSKPPPPPPSEMSMGASAGVIYAQAANIRPMATHNHVDNTVYYAASVPLTQLEVPPQLLQLQQLPNGNIHITLPMGRPITRAPLPQFNQPPPTVSPTDSQMKYSFEHEPIYDVPPQMDTVVLSQDEEEFDSVYGSVTAPESDSTVC
ncbi:hypothetical protein PENTCL1PPCAC_21886, partial [Pristionchus entomophagus]